MQSIWEDLKREFESGTNITRLILVNVVVFILVALLNVFVNFPGSDGGATWFQVVWRNLTLSNDWMFNMTHPWVFITHMFLHLGFWHILWNMLFLYWFGRRVGDLIGEKHIYAMYFYGGIAGAIFLLVSSSLFGYIPEGIEVFAHGASAAVLAFVVGAAVLNPESYMHLLLLGPVKLKYIAFAIVLLDVLALGSSANTGGHFGHLGGAAMGWFYIYALRNGLNLSTNGLRKKQNSETKIRVLSDYPKKSKSSTFMSDYFTKRSDHESIVRNLDDEVDRILDKIREKGIDSLSEEEKNTLQKASKDK